MDMLMQNVGAAAAFAVLGVALFLVAFWVVDMLTPGSLWKDLIEQRNTAVGILMGSVAIGLSIIIAAAIH
jgi:putative membrane protein